MKRNKLLIGLTGGIGSGKSVALRVLKEYGIKVISCDEEVNVLYKKHSVLRKLKIVFPEAIAGRIFYKADKKKIAAMCFSDKDKLGFLQNTLSKRAFENALKKAKKYSVCVMEVPLLFESSLEKYFDKIIVIKRDYETRIKDVQKRSGLTREEVMCRINNQIDYGKTDFSKYIEITNDANMDEFRDKVLSCIENIMESNR